MNCIVGMMLGDMSGDLCCRIVLGAPVTGDGDLELPILSRAGERVEGTAGRRRRKVDWSIAGILEQALNPARIEGLVFLRSDKLLSTDRFSNSISGIHCNQFLRDGLEIEVTPCRHADQVDIVAELLN